MQIFANPECTEYADGSTAAVYARVNVPWGFGGGWYDGSPDIPGTRFKALGPSTGLEEDKYIMELWTTLMSRGRNQPFNAGDVVEMFDIGEFQPISNPTVIFSKP